MWLLTGCFPATSGSPDKDSTDATASSSAVSPTTNTPATSSGTVELPEVDCAEVATTFSPCEGDVVGTWRFAASCAGGGTAEAYATCGTPVVWWLRTYEGTAEFVADGACTFDGSEHFDSVEQWPATCVTTSCVEFAVELAGTYGEAEASCVDDGAGGCACDVHIDDEPLVIEDWWVEPDPEPARMEVGQISESSSVAYEQWNWCVTGDQLVFRDAFDNFTVLVRE